MYPEMHSPNLNSISKQIVFHASYYKKNKNLQTTLFRDVIFVSRLSTLQEIRETLWSRGIIFRKP